MESLFWPMVLLLFAVLLIFMEIFIPSGGIISVFSCAAVIASVAVGFSRGVTTGMVVLLIDLVVVPLTVVLAFKSWRYTPLGRTMIIRRPDNAASVLPDTEEYRLRQVMIGKRGVAKTPLLPSGDIVIEGRTFDAVSKGMPIEAGQRIEIVDVSALRLVVRPLSERQAAEDDSNTPDDVLSTPIDALGIDPLDDPLA